MEKWERWDNKERMADEYELKCLIQDREGLITEFSRIHHIKQVALVDVWPHDFNDSLQFRNGRWCAGCSHTVHLLLLK